MFGFRVNERREIDAHLHVRDGSVAARQRDRGRALGPVQLDLGIDRGHTGGPVLGRDGKLVGFAVQGEPGDGLAEMIPAERMAEMLRGEIRGGAARWVADWSGHCHVQVGVTS